jgi:hypothetical protein
MDPQPAFHAICAAPCAAAKVKELKAHELARLIEWLRASHERGVKGLVLGLAELEAADRFVKAHP